MGTWWCALYLVVLSIAGCATLRNDRTVCAESRDLRCAADPICSYDDARQCRVCRCGEPFHVERAEPEPIPESEPK